MSSDIEKELERTTQMRGFRYGLHDFVAHLGGAAALKKVNDNVEATYLKQGLVDRKTKELVIVAALVALKDKHSHRTNALKNFLNGANHEIKNLIQY